VASGWTVDRRSGPAAVLHGLDPALDEESTIRVLDVDAAALVLGSAQPVVDVDGAAAAELGVDVVRRHSGGGAVLLEPGAVVWVDVIVPRHDPRWDDDVVRSMVAVGEWFAGALADLGVSDLAVHRGRLDRTPLARLLCFGGLGPGEVTSPLLRPHAVGGRAARVRRRAPAARRRDLRRRRPQRPCSRSCRRPGRPGRRSPAGALPAYAGDGPAGRAAAQVDAAEVVVGDRLLLEPGDRVPADASVAGPRLRIDTSMLTGESDRHDRVDGEAVLAGTFVVEGEAEPWSPRPAPTRLAGIARSHGARARPSPLTRAGRLVRHDRRASPSASGVLFFALSLLLGNPARTASCSRSASPWRSSPRRCCPR
jgi:hypothetical protein